MFLTSIVLIAAIGLIILLIVKRDPSPVISQKVNFGIHRGPHSSLIYIALERGFFKKNGIDASVKEYEAGRLAVDALLAGDVDIATAPEFVHVSKSFGDQKLQILGTISTADDQEIVARRDRGIKEVKDLAGKKIATAREGIARFFLETFLTAHDVQLKSITAVNLLPSEMGEAIASGRVDAVTIFAPHTHLIKAALGTNGVSWSSQNGQSYYFTLTSKEGFIRSHRDGIERILRSLIEADRYLKNEEADARKIIEKRLNMTSEMLSFVWPQYRFQVRLDQDLIILMEDEARWLNRDILSGGTAMPDYFKQIYIDGLDKIAPSAVGVFH
ncbi:MAG: NrtA/SsuA/CpmA family ABC transporter substrate-binding protein [Syntrophales bacterium]|nr:NrtA/SsuA/CpmA family ABC transporter substrate-binding protein [Syntrophales bacterium]MCK9392151.1 NrtA/SsuA/CpmA family ABC transporter substrate-binding protein [Syntrophales bacterium]